MLLNAIDDRHDPFDVPVEDIALLEALESNLTGLFDVLTLIVVVLEDDLKAIVGDIVHHRGQLLV